MSRQWLSRLVALVLLVIGFCCAICTTAFAEPTIETLTAPNVEPDEAYAHGDGSVTIANNDCSSYEKESKENGAVTISPEGTVLSGIPRVEGEWDTTSCANYVVAGFDNTVYVVQVGSAANNFPHRVIAVRNGVQLWAVPFADPTEGCSKRPAYIQSMALGQDGNLYAAVYWPFKSKSCPEKDGLGSINTSTGVEGIIELPHTGSASRGSSVSEIMPYENGVAILNGNEVFYYNYESEAESGKTFTAIKAEETVIETKIVPDTGRIYWYNQFFNSEAGKNEKALYYRGVGGSTNEKIALPKEKQLVGIAVTPSNGVVAEWKESSGTKGFTYVNEEGSAVYEQVLSTETGATVQEAGLTHWIMVDDFGNVIVRRILDQSSGDHDRNVVVDSFSPADIKTRLFNSASLGKNGVVDSFTSTSPMAQNMGKGYVYLTLCHVEGKITEGCGLAQSPAVLSIQDSSIGEYDYPRSAVFGAGLEKSSYVALGDSYSSGEGVPDFIPPSDEDGCHRSYNAYPVYLSELSPSLRLDAFVACSGAKTTDIEEGMNGEPSQLSSLSSDTKVVTLTAGGNNIGFDEFAMECVLFTCDSSSSAYKHSMEQIAIYLPGELEELYEKVHEYAENAEVYVVGYPQVTPEPGVSCAFLTNSEKEAAKEVVEKLDKAIEEAAGAAEGEFTYVNPNSGASPFIGHELCTAESYFNGLELPEYHYSFHPNILGQHAYAILISEAL